MLFGIDFNMNNFQFGKGGYPSTTREPSGGGRDNDPPHK